MNEELLEDLRENYPKLKSTYFAEKYNVEWLEVRRLIKKYKLGNPRKQSLEEIKPLLIEDYKSGKLAHKLKLSAKYRVGTKMIEKWFDEEGIETNALGSWCVKYECNENFFEKLDSPEKAYWFGFIAADGYLHDKKLGISLQKSDVGHLLLLQEALGANFKMFPFRNAMQLWVGRKKIYEDLKNLGLSERKTYTLDDKIFDFVPEKYIIAFCHGYFDGDGCVGLQVKKSGLIEPYFHLIANKPFLIRFSQEIERHTGVKLGKISFAKRTKQSYYVNKHIGKAEIVSLYEAFYKSENSSTHFLERKRIRLYKRYERELATL